MPHIVVTVPKSFRYGGKRGLAAWIAEGCLPGEEADDLYIFNTAGPKPRIEPGERVYIVCERRLRGYAPLVEMRFRPFPRTLKWGDVQLIRGAGAVAVTIDDPIDGFRGWRYRWWDDADERPFPDWMQPDGQPAMVKTGKTLF
ncbi:MAG: hypothetical protein ACYCQK_01285 [Acidiferrobacteraceae bacterium]